MKALLVLVLGSLCGAAMAGEANNAEQIPVEQYSYSQHLDIARVISMSEVPNVCEVVPARMTYEDSKGQKHILEYRVMGERLLQRLIADAQGAALRPFAGNTINSP